MQYVHGIISSKEKALHQKISWLGDKRNQHERLSHLNMVKILTIVLERLFIRS